MQYWEAVGKEDIEQIHESACRMLEELGMRIRNPEVVAVLLDAGAKKVDDQTVRIPRELVEQSISRAPETFEVFDRRGGQLGIGGREHHHLIGGTMTEILEYPAWTRRPATLRDVRDLTRIVDALDSVDMAIPMVEGRDAPQGMGEILSCAEVLKNTTKFCWACPVEARANRAFVDMAKVLAGTPDLSSRPIVGLLSTMLPGYEIDVESSHVLLLAAREGLPVILMGGSIGGMQAPATMAGALVMKVAEELAGLCVVQTVRPGSPCLMDFGHIKLDMQTAEIEEAGPDFHLAIAVGAQLARRYGIPSYSCPSSDSKIADFQAGWEMAAGLETAMLAGTHVTVNAATASKCSAASYELLVLHNEMLRHMLRLRRGMVVNEETLAVELQKELGIRGEYLTHPHTLKHIRSSEEYLQKDLFDRSGIRALYEDPCIRAHARWNRILKEHVPGVPAAAQNAVDAVVARYAGG
ncbi:MAG: trimethylamine methyltransferase family protein [Lentisphaerae bacterium]|nr:trimethylamine methyltransferase family protein [Lentisphaerota bacterium]